MDKPMDETKKYNHQDLIKFATDVLTAKGFPQKQAMAAAYVLVEAELRGDPAHGLVEGLDEIISKIEHKNRIIEIAEYKIDPEKYPSIITVDANGTLGHYAALQMIPKVVEKARKFGMAKAYIRNSSHFGDCGVYSEIIAREGLAARVSCTSPQWTKPFIEPQTEGDEERYEGAAKRFGTNPFAWSMPYGNGIVTIDMATTQRAVSPAIDIAKHNLAVLGIETKDGKDYIGIGSKRKELIVEYHTKLAALERESLMEELAKLGYEKGLDLRQVQEGLLKGPRGEEIRYPLGFDSAFKKNFWVAPLGGTNFGYKGYGLGMLVELDNVAGGGCPELIRQLDENRQQMTNERVSQTIEAYAIDMLPDAYSRLERSVETTRQCGNKYLLLPGQKEQYSAREKMEKGIPYKQSEVEKLEKIGRVVGVPFELEPVK